MAGIGAVVSRPPCRRRMTIYPTTSTLLGTWRRNSRRRWYGDGGAESSPPARPGRRSCSMPKLAKRRDVAQVGMDGRVDRERCVTPLMGQGRVTSCGAPVGPRHTQRTQATKASAEAPKTSNCMASEQEGQRRTDDPARQQHARRPPRTPGQHGCRHQGQVAEQRQQRRHYRTGEEYADSHGRVAGQHLLDLRRVLPRDENSGGKQRHDPKAVANRWPGFRPGQRVAQRNGRDFHGRRWPGSVGGTLRLWRATEQEAVVDRSLRPDSAQLFRYLDSGSWTTENPVLTSYRGLVY